MDKKRKPIETEFREFGTEILSCDIPVVY